MYIMYVNFGYPLNTNKEKLNKKDFSNSYTTNYFLTFYSLGTITFKCWDRI